MAGLKRGPDAGGDMRAASPDVTPVTAVTFGDTRDMSPDVTPVTAVTNGDTFPLREVSPVTAAGDTPVDLDERFYGRLMVTGRIGEGPGKWGRWRCLCECGGEIEADGRALIRGLVKSCGCVADETLRRSFRRAKPVKRTVKPWTEAELIQAQAWRDCGHEYPEIGARLGRSGQSVRLKLYDAEKNDDRITPAADAPRAKAWRADVGPRDAVLVKLLRAAGGFTALSTRMLARSHAALCLPRVGAGGVARPEGWKDGVTQDAAHLAALRAWWKARDAAEAEARRGERD